MLNGKRLWYMGVVPLHLVHFVRQRLAAVSAVVGTALGRVVAAIGPSSPSSC